MNTTAQLANRLREVVLHGTWVANTNYKAELENIDWKVAITKFQSLNTISILAQHVHYYVNGIKNFFENGKLEIRDKESFTFPSITSQTEWESFLTKFWNDTEKLADLIEKIPDNRLSEVFVDEKYGTYLRNLEGIMEHSYYHLGQIVLIKKMILNNLSTK